MGRSVSRDVGSGSCSFCGKAQEEVGKLVAGVGVGLFICDQCIDLCKEIIEEETGDLTRP